MQLYVNRAVIFLLLMMGCSKDPEVTMEEPPAQGTSVVDVSKESVYLYIESLIKPQSGLVSSRTNECFTTVYKNSLAAMVFIHEGNISAAERIFDVFNSSYLTAINFQGFPQDWDACTGKPTNTNYWEGDNAFLLLALNYYVTVEGSATKYSELRTGLKAWLLTRSDSCNTIVAEGVANMYAALKPYESEAGVQDRLIKLENCFYESVDEQHVLDHIVRSALVFSDTTGFQYVVNFRRIDTWVFDHQTVDTAYSAFTGENYINVEISAQLLLTQRIFLMNTSNLEKQLQKLGLYADSVKKSAGLPYYVIVPPNVNWNPATLPIIDPSCYLLFYYWAFNPFTGGP